jgi:hypothetical protein
MLLSTFELLLKKITPSPGNVAGSDRSLLQGYFLNVANPTTANRRVRLRFTATSPSLDPAQLLQILDTTGSNNFSGSLVADGPNRFRYDFRLDAGDTGLFILQPNILTLDPAADEVEVRGFVEIFIVTPFGGPASPLLVTPEHRGTFLPSTGGTGDFDQLIVALPTSTGAGLLNVDTIPSFVRPPILEEVVPLPVIPEFPVGDELTVPAVLTAMAQRIELLESGLASSRQ